MTFKPHAYQKYAINYIETHPVSALLLDMGLGKTVITLTAIKNLMFDSFEISKVLVVAPLRVARDTWPDEIEKWSHLSGLTYSVIVGTKKERERALLEPSDIYIVNRENVCWLVDNCQFLKRFDMVVIDELSSFKSYQSKRFRAMIKIRPYIKRIVGLTGTPSSNGLMDLWAQFRLLDQGQRLGRFISHYQQQYFDPDKRNGMVIYSYKPKPEAKEKIFDVISDIAVSMSAEDYLDMPEYLSNEIKVKLEEKEKTLYQNLKKDMVVSIQDRDIDAINAASLSNKLLQMANGCVYDEDKAPVLIHNQKLDRLEEVIEASNGKPILIVYWFQHDKERIQQRFNAKLLQSREDFNLWNEGEIPLALIHPASAGHGLNLQSGGSTLVWFSLMWSLELYQQTNARLYRQGQTQPVIVHHLICEDTIDEEVMKALKQKDQSQSTLLEAVKAELEV